MGMIKPTYDRGLPPCIPFLPYSRHGFGGCSYNMRYWGDVIIAGINFHISNKAIWGRLPLLTIIQVTPRRKVTMIHPHVIQLYVSLYSYVPKNPSYQS